jgi:hypothetical protein
MSSILEQSDTLLLKGICACGATVIGIAEKDLALHFGRSETEEGRKNDALFADVMKQDGVSFVNRVRDRFPVCPSCQRRVVRLDRHS